MGEEADRIIDSILDNALRDPRVFIVGLSELPKIPKKTKQKIRKYLRRLTK